MSKRFSSLVLLSFSALIIIPACSGDSSSPSQDGSAGSAAGGMSAAGQVAVNPTTNDGKGGSSVAPSGSNVTPSGAAGDTFPQSVTGAAGAAGAAGVSDAAGAAGVAGANSINAKGGSGSTSDNRGGAAGAHHGSSGAGGQGTSMPPANGARWIGEDGTDPVQFEMLTGAKVRVHLAFSNWTESWGNQFSFTAKAITKDQANGVVTMMTWGSNDNAPNILMGKYDAYLHTWARNAAADKRLFLLRMDHEFNGFWYPWGIGGTSKVTPQQFAAMWRHVHDIFVQEGATNVKWVWCPNSADKPGGAIVDFTQAFPGDSYIDYLGLDSYNFGTAQKNGSWHTFSDIFVYSYNLITKLSNKPLILCETASTELGGSKAAWITDAFEKVIPNMMPNVVGVIWFNENKETNWLVDSSPASLKAFQAVATDPKWQAPFTLVR